MRLIDVYTILDAPTYLYALLAEREPWMNISHARMPTVAQHLAFVRSRPYAAWYLIEARGQIVGATYLTREREVGIFIFKQHQRHGYGAAALQQLKRLHPGKILANINPANKPSRKFFERMGFKFRQVTYELQSPMPRTST